MSTCACVPHKVCTTRCLLSLCQEQLLIAQARWETYHKKEPPQSYLDCVRTSKTVTNNMYLSYSQPLLHNHSAQAAIVPIPRSFIFGALYRESRRKSLHYCRFSTHPTMLRYAETRHLPSGKGSVVQSWRSTPIASLFAPCTCCAHTCCPQESSLSVKGSFRAIARHW